ncbi:MAG: hypothetical protein MJZ65_00395 [Paludibacteraceae bacterium]|nr:hypothetical protein [Paludibacteraceae bacterium]
MKKIFFFASAMVAALAMNAQTIVIDGNNSEWANVPMMTEPGEYPVLKSVVAQQGVTLVDGTMFNYMVEQKDNWSADYTGGSKGCNIYVENAGGTNFKDWNVFYYTDEPNTWDNASSFSGKVLEGSIKTANLTVSKTAPFGFVFAADWGNGGLIPNTPDNLGWKWDQKYYHALTAKPYSYVNLNGTLAVADAYARFQFLTPGAVADFDICKSSANDTAAWVAWPVELVTPGTYTITINGDFTETNTGIRFFLVDVATNAVVATIDNGEWGTWAPASGFEHSKWDLSKVPAGKYMLKMKSYIAWSTIKVSSVTLYNPEAPTGFNPAATVAAPAKMIKNGRFMINNNGKYINAMGF